MTKVGSDAIKRNREFKTGMVWKKRELRELGTTMKYGAIADAHIAKALSYEAKILLRHLYHDLAIATRKLVKVGARVSRVALRELHKYGLIVIKDAKRGMVELTHKGHSVYHNHVKRMV